jgi:hypothetical protein
MSEDGGATWTEIEQINDVAGTVVGIEDSIDMHEGGIVWVDERGEDWDIYIDELLPPVPAPKLVLGEISGGIGASVTITNEGDAPATDVQWEIILDGTVFIGGEASGTIANLGVGASETVKSGFPLGFGAIDIDASVTCAEGSSDDASASGKLLLFFIIMD